MRSNFIISWLKMMIILRSHGEGNGNPLQYSCLENPMDGGAWWAAVHGVAESRARLHFHFHFSLCALEKEMATHSSVLAWRIPGTGEPGGLLSTGSHRVRHDWSNLAAAAASRSNLTYFTDYDLSDTLMFCIYIFYHELDFKLLEGRIHVYFSILYILQHPTLGLRTTPRRNSVKHF